MSGGLGPEPEPVSIAGYWKYKTRWGTFSIVQRLFSNSAGSRRVLTAIELAIPGLQVRLAWISTEQDLANMGVET
jgi:hypothetical protein